MVVISLQSKQQVFAFCMFYSKSSRCTISTAHAHIVRNGLPLGKHFAEGSRYVCIKTEAMWRYRTQGKNDRAMCAIV